jgi:hypothetical protein
VDELPHAVSAMAAMNATPVAVIWFRWMDIKALLDPR